MLKLIFIILLSILPFCAFAQLESAIWYFGVNVGLDFRSGTAVPIYDGQLATLEGCASISDFEGNLQFYTDGVSVWNRNHELMPNGTDLSGDSSSTQSAIIVPMPGQSRKYYIFTVGTDDRMTGSIDILEGFNYYIADMSLEVGLGDVEAFSGDGNAMEGLVYTSEKLAATIHPDKKSYWLLTHFEDTFYAYLITESGIQPPIITSIGPNLPSGVYPVNARGYLKFSPSGNIIAIAHLSYLQTPLTDSHNGYSDNAADGILATYDFDRLTGIVSNEVVLNGDNYTNVEGTPYGIEFSPNSQLLYAEYDYHRTDSLSNVYHDYSKMYQYNLATNPADRYLVADVDIFENNGRSRIYKARGALQLGLDGNIYYSCPRNPPNNINTQGISALSVINNPDEVGEACNYTHESLLITTELHPNTYLTYGLPPFVSSFFSVEIILNLDINNSNFCLDEEIIFEYHVNDDVESVLWDFGDGTYSTNLSTSHTYSTIGTYTVTLQIVTSAGEIFETSRQITVSSPIEFNPVNLSSCDYDFDGIASFNLNDAITSIQDQVSTNYFIELFYSEEDAFNNINPIENLNEFFNTIGENQLYVRINSECPSFTEVNLLIIEPPQIEGETIFRCLADEQVFLEVAEGFGSYEWTDELGNILGIENVIEVNENGIYYLTVSNNTICSAEVIFEVIDYIVPIITSVEVINNEDIIVFTNSSEQLYYSIDGINWQPHPYFYNVPFGNYWVQVRNSNGCLSIPYSIGILNVPNVITPNNDGINDNWIIPGLAGYPNSVVSIYDRYGKLLHTFTSPPSGFFPHSSSDIELPRLNNPIIWNGLYLGRKVPSTSYWYIIQLKDGRTFKAWLTVKNY